MVANTAPIFSKAPADGWATVTAANTAKDGTGTVVTLFTAGADGAFIQKIVAMPLGTNVASVARFFLNNGSTNATPANNSLFGNLGLPATTNTEVAAQTPQELNVNVGIEAGRVINVVLGTAVAAGWQFTVFAGEF